MMSKLRQSLAGPGYVILNVIRALNIIVFIDTIAACVVMLVKIKTENGFFFFEAVTHAVVALINSICVDHIGTPHLRSFVNRRWPMFGEEAGFLSLAVIMMIIGVSTLGNLNSDTMSQKKLGVTFWRIVLSAGILGMIMSLINILATLIFSDSEAGVSARHIRAHGAVAPQKLMSRTNSRRSLQLSLKREDSVLPGYSREPTSAFKRASQRFTNRFPLKISSPLRPPEQQQDAASSRYSRETAEPKMPDPAHHPAMNASYV
ncbi:hypothetical protein N7470_002951 [Penicillium chermesinum]|nr:hypothetical protein N7470_002951 [Penicillium chermesinum]